MSYERLVFLNVWSPGPFRRPDHGTTLAYDPDADPNGVCALAESLVRWSQAGCFWGREVAAWAGATSSPSRPGVTRLSALRAGCCGRDTRESG